MKLDFESVRASLEAEFVSVERQTETALSEEQNAFIRQA